MSYSEIEAMAWSCVALSVVLCARSPSIPACVSVDVDASATVAAAAAAAAVIVVVAAVLL